MNPVSVFPTQKDETWRLFDLARLAEADRFAEVPASPVIEKEARGAVVGRFKDAAAGAGEGYFFEANARRFRDGLSVRIPAGVRVDGTLHVRLRASGGAEGKKFHPRLRIVAEKGSACRIAVHSGARSGGYFMNAVVEVTAEEDADLRLVSLQDAGPGAIELTAWRVDSAARSRVEHTEIMTGGGAVRNDMRVRLAGPDALVYLNGLSVLSDAAQMHNHTVVVHEAPRTLSRQLFKDILAGTARSEYSGLVHVKREAVKSDSNQLCRNLLLSETARANSRPQLRIDTDDVKCSHGSATGQLPGNELFYLRSRGLSLEEARAMLIEGFAEEVVLALPEEDEALRRDAHRRVHGELERVAGLLPEEALA
ncbi:MAG TPA: Fe-S cluster assembly protein SufD [Candidatus Eisenbacteria bacterium]|jgi:Fe-S cluster assembly protein SufD|nr:Fe-S cluster assembly protein SufD [Candidatus Eisenbacteria bacterium]